MPSEARSRRAQRDADLRLIQSMKEAAPQELKDFFARTLNEACDLAEKYNLPPREMAVYASSMIGCFAMTEVGGNVHANRQIDDFLAFAATAMSVAVAAGRIAAGWRPAGLN